MTQIARAYYGGFPCEVEFTMTLGISPGSGTISFEDTNTPVPRVENLRISDNQRDFVILEVYADKPRIEYDAESGRRLVATIYDRRFRWRYGAITGTYNKVGTNGVPEQDYNLPTLLEMCLAALGESNVSLFGVAKDRSVFPEVNWEWQNPAAALQKLCEKQGLVVGIQQFGDQRIVIAPWDYPRRIPSDPVMYVMSGRSRDILPRKLVLVGGRKVIQKTFKNLVPVGMETDGTIKKIDDLSYAPGSSWGEELSSSFRNISDPEERKLAEKCVFKWYSIDWGVYDRSVVLPLLNRISITVVKNGKEEHDKPYVVGKTQEWNGISFKTSLSGRISEGYSVNKDTGIVEFSDWMVVGADKEFFSNGFFAETLDLVAAFELKTDRKSDFVWWDRKIVGGTLDIDAVHKERSLIGYFMSDQDNNLTALNKIEIDEYAKKSLSSLIKEYTISFPAIYRYAGALPLGPWGIFSSVGWSIDNSGIGTELQVNVEVPRPQLPGYKERLQSQKIKILWDESDNLSRAKELYPFD